MGLGEKPARAMSVKPLTHGRGWVPRLRRLQSCQARTAANNAAVAPSRARFRAHSLTHGARAILTEGIVVKRVRRKLGARHECKISDSCRGLGATAALFAAVPGARHECKISYSCPRRGATAALFAAVPGAHTCEQRPERTAAGTTRLRAHSLTHGMRAILMEGIVVKRVTPKTGARHVYKISYSWRALPDGVCGRCSVAPPGLRARGRRGSRAPFGRPGLRMPRSYGANIGGPEGRGCLAPGAVPARRAGTSPGSAAVPARQAPPGAPGILEGPAARPVRFRAHSLTHGMRAVLRQGVAMQRIRRKSGAGHECKISYSWPGPNDVGQVCPTYALWVPPRRDVVFSRAGAARLRTTQPWHQS